MSDDIPVLGVPANELWQWAQAVNAITTLLTRLQARRTLDGRLAFADDEHAALVHEARQHPPIRLMTTGELVEWHHRVPASVRARPADGPVSVWAARVVDDRGRPTGEWGLEAHTWADGVVTASLVVVCRDADDAVALSRYLREHPTVETLHRIDDLAVHAQDRSTVSHTSPAPVAEPPAERDNPLSEAQWAAHLREHLPPDLADRIIVTDPGHRHHTAWRELHQLAREEVLRVGADPARLAMLIATGPRWRADVRNPPALAHWAITEARTSPTYPAVITTDPVARTLAEAPRPVTGDGTRPRLVDVRHPDQALAWATSLQATNPEHRVEAKAGFGRWGTAVDALLSTKFPTLVHTTRTTTQTTPRTTIEASATGQRPVDVVPLAELLAEVDRLDPDKAIDRRAAHIMLGRMPTEVDRRIADRFGTDPQVRAKLAELYPDGLPDPGGETAAQHNQAQAHEAAAAAAAGVPDDPATAQREDIPQVAAGERTFAERHRGLAATSAGQPPAHRTR